MSRGPRIVERRRWSSLLVAALVVGICPGLATAGGMWLPARGVGPLGRAGAVVASGRDPHGIWYNPALLALADGHRLLVDVAMIDLGVSYTRADGLTRTGEAVDYPVVENQAFPQWIPELLFSSDLGSDQFAIGVGVFAPNAPRYRFPEDGPQRYALVDNTASLLLYEEIAFAWRPVEQFSIGVGLQNMTAEVDSTVVASSWVGIWGEPEDLDLDILINIHGADPITIAGNAGVWGRPVEGLELAASFQLPVTIQDDAAKLRVRLPSHYAFDNASVEGDTLNLRLELPWILRAGVRYGVEALFDIELDVTYEAWSVHDTIQSTPRDIKVVGVPTVGQMAVGPLNIPRKFKDVLGVQLGGDWHVLPEVLIARAGFFYEQGAIPDETFSVFQVDSDKFAPTVGLRARLDGWVLDAAYSHIFQVERAIANSEIEQVNPTYEDGATIVGNGVTSSGYDILGLGVGYVF